MPAHAVMRACVRDLLALALALVAARMYVLQQRASLTPAAALYDSHERHTAVSAMHQAHQAARALPVPPPCVLDFWTWYGSADHTAKASGFTHIVCTEPASASPEGLAEFADLVRRYAQHAGEPGAAHYDELCVVAAWRRMYAMEVARRGGAGD